MPLTIRIADSGGLNWSSLDFLQTRLRIIAKLFVEGNNNITYTTAGNAIVIAFADWNSVDVYNIVVYKDNKDKFMVRMLPSNIDFTRYVTFELLQDKNHVVEHAFISKCEVIWFEEKLEGVK